MSSEQMNIVIVGHVDHGKSTLIGRLLADTGSLPEGKLDQVKAMCAVNARPFEYAFLLDALKDEQSQGITIDTARSFFKTKKRDYIIIDAPGHIEFLKNMITGAARAEAALLLIDAHEGVQENSKRHGFLLSFLGIKQVVVLVNKMDLANYDEPVFKQITEQYSVFLKEIGVEPKAFIPIAAREGENLIKTSPKMPWYKGKSVLDFIDGFEKEKGRENLPFRFPVQDIYKFTEQGDDRRIVAGTVETGSIRVGDDVLFLPSQKKSTIKTIESFNTPEKQSAGVDQAVGFTLATQIYIRPGEIMVKANETPVRVASTFRANIFWLGKKPMIKDKKYKLKLATGRASLYLKDVVHVMDASELTTEQNKTQIERNDVAECILQTMKPIAMDLNDDSAPTGRFVVIDDFEIAGGGIVTECLADSHVTDYIEKREYAWERSKITPHDRAVKFNQRPKFIVITGPSNVGKIAMAKALEEELFKAGNAVYFLGISNLLTGSALEDRDEHIRRLGEMAHLFTDAGQILISTVSDLDDAEAKFLQALSEPMQVLAITVGQSLLDQFPVEWNFRPNEDPLQAVEKIREILRKKDVIPDYYL